MRYFNAHVGNKKGCVDAFLNDDDSFLQLCCNNALCIIITFF